MELPTSPKAQDVQAMTNLHHPASNGLARDLVVSASAPLGSPWPVSRTAHCLPWRARIGQKAAEGSTSVAAGA